MRWLRGVVLLVSFVALVVPGTASATTVYPHTDIMIVFDTSGSMGDALGEAADEITEAMSEIDSRLPDAEYGLSEVRDYPGSEYEEEEDEDDDFPWRLDLPMTADRAAVADAVQGLEASAGGDNEEAYGRALWETDTNPAVGWRPGARHLIVLVADDVPHDGDLDEGIPAAQQAVSAPWNTGIELIDPAGVAATQLAATTNLDWQGVLGQLGADGKPLEFVDYQGESEYLPYWQNWAARTGGQAVLADAGQFVQSLVGLAESGGQVCSPVAGSVSKRLLASLRCTGAMTVLEAECGLELSLGKVLKALFAVKGLLEVNKLSKGVRPLARLVNDIKKAKYFKHAPRGFRNPHEVVETLLHGQEVWDLVGALRGLAKAIPRNELKEIALDIGELAGAKACVKGLLLAVQ